jgi:hypothetical protein
MKMLVMLIMSSAGTHPTSDPGSIKLGGQKLKSQVSIDIKEKLEK